MSEYRDKVDKMVWSYSRATTFEQCKYSFYLNYINDDRKTYPVESNYYADVGIFVHEILAKVYEGEFSMSDAYRYFREHYNEAITARVKPETMEKKFETCSNFFAEEDWSWLDNYEVLGVEMKCKFEIRGYPFVGYIDLLVRDRRDGKIVVIDNKSSEYPFKRDGSIKSKSQHSFSNYKKQMYLYSYAVMEKYGEFPKEITWFHFMDGGKFATIPFKESEFNEAVDWFIDTIHEVEQEEDFPENEEYFYCSTLCNFRHSCEYHKAAMRKNWNKKK